MRIDKNIVIAVFSLVFASFYTAENCKAADPAFYTFFFGYLLETPEIMCTPNIQSRGKIRGGTEVTLPTVSIADMEHAHVNITFEARGCTGIDINHMWVRFTSSDLDIDGRLIPKDSNLDDAPFRFELYDTDSANRIIIGKLNPSLNERGTSADFSGHHYVSSNREASKTYQVRYYVPPGAPAINPGTYTTSATANFVYH